MEKMGGTGLQEIPHFSSKMSTIARLLITSQFVYSMITSLEQQKVFEIQMYVFFNFS